MQNQRRIFVLKSLILLVWLTLTVQACDAPSYSFDSTATLQPDNTTATQTGVSTNSSSSTPLSTPTNTLLPTITPKYTQTTRPTASTDVDVELNPTSTVAPTLDTRLPPTNWRQYPIVPELSANATKILLQAKENPAIILNHFSAIGDCQMVSTIFLGAYTRSKYPPPTGTELTLAWFNESTLRESITAYNGLGINSILNPMFGYAAGHTECEKNETPLQCELRINRPSVALIGMGTNWKPNAEISFENSLRIVVDQILENGTLPILATKADNVEQDWKLNEVIARVAYDYDLPLVNVWRAVQNLPGKGLQEPPKQTYLTPEGWLARNEAWLYTLKKVYQLLQPETSN